MQGFYYLLSLIGLGIVGWWLMTNDRLPPGAPTKGLLRMRPPKGAAAADAAANADRKKPEDSAGLPG